MTGSDWVVLLASATMLRTAANLQVQLVVL